MATDPVLAKPALTASIATGGEAVTLSFGGDAGGYLVNPATAADQGLSAPEPLYVDPVGQCAECSASGTIFRLEPGQTWSFIPGQLNDTWANAATSGHKFSIVLWEDVQS